MTERAKCQKCDRSTVLPPEYRPLCAKHYLEAVNMAQKAVQASAKARIEALWEARREILGTVLYDHGPQAEAGGEIICRCGEKFSGGIRYAEHQAQVVYTVEKEGSEVGQKRG